MNPYGAVGPLALYKKNLLLIVILAMIFHWSCKKDTNPVEPPPNDTANVTYAGKIYHAVKIGDQIWLKENLDVGTMIQGTNTAKNNDTIEKFCYNNNTANCTTYGGLYQWNEAMQYSATPGTQGICPTGWHIPTLAEFQTLDSTLHGDGNALKAVGQGDSTGAGTNTSGFSALLAGYRDYDGYFYGLRGGASVWSSSEFPVTCAHGLFLIASGNGIYLSFGGNEFGYSVRCIKN